MCVKMVYIGTSYPGGLVPTTVRILEKCNLELHANNTTVNGWRIPVMLLIASVDEEITTVQSWSLPWAGKMCYHLATSCSY